MFNSVYKNKRVLVTGHTGFKGSWLTTWLLKMGAKVAGYSIGIPSTPSHFEDLNIQSKIQHYLGDIRDFQNFFQVCKEFKPEFIFHLAAQPLVRYSYIEPHETFEVNVLGTLNVLECIRQLNEIVKVGVIITSDKCYDNVEWLYGYRENDKLGGEDPYSGSKGAAELVAKSYCKSYFNNNVGPRVLTVRAGNVIGGGDWATDRIVPDIVKSWQKNNDVSIRNPYSTRPWQHVLEPLSGYLMLGYKLYESNDLNGEAFNFGPDSTINKSVKDLLEEMILNWKNSPGWLDHSDKNPNTSKESNLLKLSCDKANILLEWFPTLNFNETIKFTSDWYINYSNKQMDIFTFTNQQIDQYEKNAIEKKLAWTI